MICAIFGKPTRQDSPLFSVPPSVQVDAQPQEAQAKDRWRGPGHDDRAVQAEKIQGVQLVWPAQGRESKANALFPENRDNSVIVVAIWIAEYRQARADFSLKIFLGTLNLLVHLFGRNFRHDGVCSRMRTECQSLPREFAELLPGQDAASLCAAQAEFGANRIYQPHCLAVRNPGHMVLYCA